MMKPQMKQQGTSFLERVLGLAAVTALATTPLLAGVSGGGSGGSGGSGAMAGDLVGTLPVVTGPNNVYEQDWVLTGKAVQKPAVQVTALLPVLEDLVLEANGEGWVWGQGVDLRGNHAQGFYGNISVWLDRAVLEGGQVASSLTVGAEFQGGLAFLEWNQRFTSGFQLGGSLGLPLATLSASDVLELGDVRLHLLSPAGKYAAITLGVEGDVLRVDQKVF